jgi:hypothetical protein
VAACEIMLILRLSIMICPSAQWQAERAGAAAALREGHVMSERVDERRSRASDIVGVAFYSILVLLLMLLWAYVPA